MSAKPTSRCAGGGCISIAPSTAAGFASGQARLPERDCAPWPAGARRLDGSQTNREAIVSCDTVHRLQERSRRWPQPLRIRQSRYLNNRIEQDHRRIKRRVRPMLGFKSFASAGATLNCIELIHMMRKCQAHHAFNPNPSLAEQFAILAD